MTQGALELVHALESVKWITDGSSKSHRECGCSEPLEEFVPEVVVIITIELKCLVLNQSVSEFEAGHQDSGVRHLSYQGNGEASVGSMNTFTLSCILKAVKD